MACRNIILFLIPFFLQKLHGNLTVVLAYCSFLCKIKNFWGTGAAFLASVRVRPCFMRDTASEPVSAMISPPPLHLTFSPRPSLSPVSEGLNLNSLPSSVSLGGGGSLNREGCFNHLALKIHKNQVSSTPQKSLWAPSILGTQNCQTCFPTLQGSFLATWRSPPGLGPTWGHSAASFCILQYKCWHHKVTWDLPPPTCIRFVGIWVT